MSVCNRYSSCSSRLPNPHSPVPTFSYFSKFFDGNELLVWFHLLRQFTGIGKLFYFFQYLTLVFIWYFDSRANAILSWHTAIVLHSFRLFSSFSSTFLLSLHLNAIFSIYLSKMVKMKMFFFMKHEGVEESVLSSS